MRILPRNRLLKWLACFLCLVTCLYAVCLPPTLTLAQSLPVRLGRVDLLWSQPESANGAASQYLSGAVQRKAGRDVNVPIAPSGGTAPYVEYADPGLPQGMTGMRWVLGSAQRVKGGFGPLSVAFGGKEPTGRKVVELGTDNPAEFKLVLVSIDQKAGTAKYEAYVRACAKHLLSKSWWTCTPYGIATGFRITLHETQTMPVDSGVPQFGFKLSDAAKAAIKQAASAIPPETPSASFTSIGTNLSPLTPSVSAGVGSSSIASTAASLRGISTADGPAGGNEACAFAVNKVLLKSVGHTIGENPNYVPSVEAALQSGQGVQVSQQNAKAGSIIIARDQRHIGICMNDGCTTVLSNSSSRAAFSWVSGSTFGGFYDGYPGTEHFYLVK